MLKFTLSLALFILSSLLPNDVDIITTLNCDALSCTVTVKNVGYDPAYDVRGEIVTNGVQLVAGRASKGILFQRSNGDWGWVIGQVGVNQSQGASFILIQTPAQCNNEVVATMADIREPDENPDDNTARFGWHCALLPTVTNNAH